MPFPKLEDLEPLEGPFEIFELPGGSSRTFTVVKHLAGRMVIHPRAAGGAKDIVALRVWVTEADKPLYPDYYDVTAQTLIPQLLPHLESAHGRPVRFSISKFGDGPRARFQVRVERL